MPRGWFRSRGFGLRRQGRPEGGRRATSQNRSRLPRPYGPWQGQALRNASPVVPRATRQRHTVRFHSFRRFAPTLNGQAIPIPKNQHGMRSEPCPANASGQREQTQRRLRQPIHRALLVFQKRTNPTHQALWSAAISLARSSGDRIMAPDKALQLEKLTASDWPPLEHPASHLSCYEYILFRK